jgi:eukaryotic-like serine/threonine-protein kinase
VEFLLKIMNDSGSLTPERISRHAIESSLSDREAESHRVRCRFAKGSDSGHGLTEELSGLLRMRLRLAILIILSAFVLHFLRNLLLPGAAAVDRRPLWLFFSGCEIAVMAVVSGLLWSRRTLRMMDLRILELTIFGFVAAYIAGLQVDSYHDGILPHLSVTGQEASVYRLVGISSVLRWCLLIVIYGTFIPNTWRRCAAVACILASIPILIMLIGSLMDPSARPYVMAAVPETIIILATAGAIAVFGSHKIRELHERAHEAQKLGQYRLKQVIGFGGMGAVYLAEHVLLRRQCAIKLIRPDQAGDPKTFLRFEREVRATATLTHWNTVEIFDYGHAEDGTFYYVMEYLPGMNLEDLVEQHGPMPPERAAHFLRQVCQALREAHSIGLIHRDIKPSNIFSSERGKVYDVAKLLDFGLVKSVGLGIDGVNLTQEGSFTGSPAFMSPEQAAGRQHLDARSDIYNVGAVAYFLITGELLFERASALQMLHAHAYESIVPNDRFNEIIPVDLKRVILRCLEKDPEHRYQDVATLDRDLTACECAGRWTPERAEDWWRQNGGITLSASSSEALMRDSQTTSTAAWRAG